MRERPILFNGQMVRAILDGSKTQTRRVVTPQPTRAGWNEGHFESGAYWKDWPTSCPYGQPGDRLWVRETALYLRPIAGDDSIADVMYEDHEDYDTCYPAKGEAFDLGWHVRPSIFMPRWASRLTLEITEVRVQRLQDMNANDAIAEGIPSRGIEPPCIASAMMYLHAFEQLWDSINAKRGHSWEKNPWVWALTFSVVPSHAP